MKNRLQTILERSALFLPHSLLLVMFFLLHNNNENYGLIPPVITLRYAALYLTICVALLLISWVVLRDWKKALLFTTPVLAVYFFFGAFHDTLKTGSLPAFFSSYKFLLPLIAVFILALFFIIRKMDSRLLSRLHIFSQCVLLVITLPEIILLVANSVGKAELAHDFGDTKKTLTSSYNPCDTCSKPDIYLIVFDAYTNSNCLREEFNFDNSETDSFLLKKGFYIATKSNSNYALSPLSLSSAFNLNYLRPDLINEKVTGKFIVQSLNTLEKSELPEIMRQQGYQVKNFSVFNLDGYPVGNSEYHTHFRKKLVNLQTLGGRVEKDILWNLAFLQSKQTAKNKELSHLANERERTILRNLKQLEQEIDRKTDTARFVYTHLMLPHEPYFFDDKGQLNPPEIVYRVDPGLYIKQLVYTNTILKDLVNKLLSDTTRPKIIIIAGDHGYREYDDASKMPKIFANLTACYFPGKDYSRLYDSISPVNLFRVVLNQHFRQDYPLLPDSSIYIKSPGLRFEKKGLQH